MEETNSREKSSLKGLIFGLITFILITTLLIGSIYFFKNRNEESSSEAVEFEQSEEKIASIEIFSDSETKDIYDVEIQEGQSVFQILETLKANEEIQFEYGEFEGLGVFVTSLNGITADSNSEYWKFLINGEEAQVGISDYIIQTGDTIQFEIEKFV